MLSCRTKDKIEPSAFGNDGRNLSFYVFLFYHSLLFYFPEEVQQSKGKESPAPGGESGHGRHLCQSGRSEQGNFHWQLSETVLIHIQLFD